EVEYAIGLTLQDQLGGQDRAGRAEPRGIPEAREHRVVSRAQAESLGAHRRLAAVTGLEHLEIIGAVVPGERALGRGLRCAHRGLRQAREAVRLHESPREPEALHPKRMMQSVVEPGPRVRVDEDCLGYRRQCPDLPPSFSTSWTFAIVTPRSTAF